MFVLRKNGRSEPMKVPVMPDHERVAIVKRVTGCTAKKAENTICELDEHDHTRQAINTTSNGDSGGNYASLPDVLPVGKLALVAAGYSHDEASYILTKLFSGLAEEHGGKRFYLPKVDKIKQRIQEFL